MTMTKFEDTEMGKTEDGSYICKISIKKNEKNEYVETKLLKNIAYMCYTKGNAFVNISPETKEITVVGTTECNTDDWNFKLIREIEMAEVYDLIAEEDKKLIDEKEKRFIIACENMTNFVFSFWLRKACKEFGFKWDSDKEVFTVGVSQSFSNVEIEKFIISIHQYKTNPDGIFWKREWVQDKELDTKKGGAKSG